jgi:hypothetical protein
MLLLGSELVWVRPGFGSQFQTQCMNASGGGGRGFVITYTVSCRRTEIGGLSAGRFRPARS